MLYEGPFVNESNMLISLYNNTWLNLWMPEIYTLSRDHAWSLFGENSLHPMLSKWAWLSILERPTSGLRSAMVSAHWLVWTNIWQRKRKPWTELLCNDLVLEALAFPWLYQPFPHHSCLFLAFWRCDPLWTTHHQGEFEARMLLQCQDECDKDVLLGLYQTEQWWHWNHETAHSC